MKKNAPEQSRGSQKYKYAAEMVNREAKIRKIITFFANGGSLNRFEAELIGDHCLNSTISTIKHSYRLKVSWQWERVPTRFATETRVKRYSLAPDQQEKAKNLLLLLGVNA